MAGVEKVAGSPAARDYRAVVAVRTTAPAPIAVTYGELHGLPAVIISDEDMAELAKPFELTLIGKFLVDRPTLAEIRKFIVRLKFFGFVKVDKHDMRNVVFRFADERDYMRFFARRLYKVFGVDMRVSKWSPFFDVDEELPIVPLWVSFPGLRFQLYHLKTLMDIAKVFGKPLCVDSNTAAQGSLTQARVLVEVDVSLKHPDRIWLGSEGRGTSQQVIIEKLPMFCEGCKRMGHKRDECQAYGLNQAKGELKWVPKLSLPVPGLEGSLPVVHGCSTGGEGNHPGTVEGPNFSNYTSYVEACRIEEARKVKENKSSNFLFNDIEIIEKDPILKLPTNCNASMSSISSEQRSDVATPGPQIDGPPVVGLDYMASRASGDTLVGPQITEGVRGSSLLGLESPGPAITGGKMATPGPCLEILPKGISEQASFPNLVQIIDNMIGNQAGKSDVLGEKAHFPVENLSDPLIPCSGPLEPKALSKEPLKGVTDHSYLSNSKLENISNHDDLVDVQVSLGGRFSLLADEEGEFDEEAGTWTGSSIKGGKKLLFSNALKIGNLLASSPPARATHSRSKGAPLGGNPVCVQDSEGWTLSKKGKNKGSTGPRAVVLDALLNPKN